MYDIVIIGGGFAGLTAALYSARFSRKVLVIEEVAFGGQIMNANEVENYPTIINTSGFELSNNLYNQVKDLGVDFLSDSVIKIENAKEKKIFTTNKEILCKSIIIASGMKRRKLEITSEDRLTSRGISYCATCDGALFKDKTVAVIGSGNTALEDGIFLSNYTKKVYMINRGNSFKGEKYYLDVLKEKKNVEFIFESQVIAISGDDKLSDITIKNKINNEEKVINLEGLFIAIGQIPNTEIYKGLINLDEYGYIKADESCKTNIDGIFVAGDIRTKEVRQLVTAASDGAVAAVKANNYIEFESK